MSKTFPELYLDAVGASLTGVARAVDGKMPSTIFLDDLVELIGDGDKSVLTRELRSACSMGALKATVTEIDLHGQKKTDGYMSFKVYRDDARRYFSSLGIEPEPGSPLWCWIRGKPATEAGKLLPVQQDKADFQQICMEIWERNSAMTITGDSGVINQQETKPYQRSYGLSALAEWAREVAPDGVKGKRGRPKKNSHQSE